MDIEIVSVSLLAILFSIAGFIWFVRVRSRISAERLVVRKISNNAKLQESGRIEQVVRALVPLRIYEWYRSLSIKSGLRKPEFTSVYLLAKVIVLGAALFIGFISFNQLLAANYFLAVILLPTIWFLPDLYLLLRANAYRRQLELDMPFWLDLHTSLVEGGMGFDEALVRICGGMNIAKRPLFGELQLIERYMQYGLSRIEALQRLARELAIPELHDVIAALVQGERLGAGMVDTLRAQAEMIRNKVWEDAQQRAHRLPVELMFPIALGVMPLTFLILVGPAAIRLLQVIGDMGKRF